MEKREKIALGCIYFLFFLFVIAFVGGLLTSRARIATEEKGYSIVFLPSEDDMVDGVGVLVMDIWDNSAEIPRILNRALDEIEKQGYLPKLVIKYQSRPLSYLVRAEKKQISK